MLMLNFLKSPLLNALFLMDYESFVFWSYLTGVVIAAPIWAWVTVQYLLQRRVERWLLQTIMTITIVHALLFTGWHVAIPLCILSVLIFSGKGQHQALEIAFVIIAHWLTGYRCHEGGMVPFYMLSAFFIITTLSFNLIFRYPGWKQWIKGEYVSIVPSYTISAIFMMVMQFHFINILTV